MAPGDIYEHFKGNRYKFISLARSSETQEELVVYEALYDNPLGQIWIRPLMMFREKVEKDGVLVDRFRRLQNTQREL